MIFKTLFKNIWAILDMIFFIAGAITFNCAGFYFGNPWGYITLTVTFILSGLLVEQIPIHKGGDA